MRPTILFKLDLDYQLHTFMPLINKAVYKVYNKESKTYEWIFNVSDLDYIIKELGKPITFEKSEEDISKLIKLCSPLKKRITVEQWKGKGQLSIISEPDIFLVGEWQKNPDTGIPTESWYKIPKQNVIAMWDVLQTFNKKEFVKVSTISEKLCRLLKFRRFFRDRGTFDWIKWWGSHRQGYLPFVYYPLKILSYYKLIEYSKRGKVKRLKDKLIIHNKNG